MTARHPPLGRRVLLTVLVGTALLSTVVVLTWSVWLPDYRPGLHAVETYGIDVSSHHGEIDWWAVARNDVAFAYIKATEGASFVDHQFRTVVYLGDDFADAYSPELPAGHRVWVRHLLTRPAEDGWYVWQVSGIARVAGIAGRVDLDVMAGA